MHTPESVQRELDETRVILLDTIPELLERQAKLEKLDGDVFGLMGMAADVQAKAAALERTRRCGVCVCAVAFFVGLVALSYLVRSTTTTSSILFFSFSSP